MAENTQKGSRSGFTPGKPQAGRTYSGKITYVDEVRETFVTQYEYSSGRLGYPVEHSMEAVNFPGLSYRKHGTDLQVGDEVEVTYPKDGNRCDVNVISTASIRDEIQREKEERASPERMAQQSQWDKETIERYANPKTDGEANTKRWAQLREATRNKRFEDVKVIAKDDMQYTVTSSNGKGDEFVHEARAWIAFTDIKVGDTISVDYLRQPFPGHGSPYVVNKSAQERTKALGWGDPDFARGGPFDHVRITSIDRDKNTIMTVDGIGKPVTHHTGKWDSEKALYQVGDVISIRLPEKDAEDKDVKLLNHSYLGRIIDKYKVLEHPFKYPQAVLRFYPTGLSVADANESERAHRAMEDIKRLYAYDLADGLNPYKSLTVKEIDKEKNTITAVNDKGVESVHSIADFRYKHDLRVGDVVSVRYNDINAPEEGLKIFDLTAYERHKVQDRFKEVRVVAINREKDYFTTQDKTGEKFNHSMRGYKWKSRLQVGHLVTIQYKDNDTSKTKDIFDHTTYQESLIKSLQRRTQEEALIKKPEKTFSTYISLIAETRVHLGDCDKRGETYYVTSDALTKALDCKISDLKRGDCIELKVKSLPNADGTREILSAKSADVEERIQEQDSALAR